MREAACARVFMMGVHIIFMMGVHIINDGCPVNYASTRVGV